VSGFAFQVDPPTEFWLSLVQHRKKLGLAARRMLSQGGLFALRSVPDLSLDLMDRLAHGAMLSQGAESWSSTLAGHRVQRYAFKGTGDGPPMLLLHGLGGAASSMAMLVPGLLPLTSRIELLELPAHGRSEKPHGHPLGARDYGAVVLAALEELHRHSGRKVVLIGNSLGGALSLFAAHEKPALCQAVVGLNPAGAELSDLALNQLPRAFDDLNLGAVHMTSLLFHRTPWPFWLIARDFARHWGTDTVQRILDDARSGSDRSLGLDVLTDIHVPVLILWGAEDRLLPNSSVVDFGRIAGVRIQQIPACGHIPQLERPGITRRAITDFLLGLR
jgi:pimeloyl-ACP methyl ester carboxylesterase